MNTFHFSPVMLNPFLSDLSDSQPAEQSQAALTLFELNSLVRSALKHTLLPTYWLMAELSQVRVASNGHCYVEFVQKDEASGAMVAKARGNIWRTAYLSLVRRFERVMGKPLVAGLQVLVQVTVTFHELYGYALNVVDINPAYTVGEMALRRKEILRQLEEDGIMDLNKELPLPRVVRRVAIISSATAAGYGDFCNQLEQSGYDFQFSLFPALMQGDRVEESVIAALDQIATELDQWDVVVIIRGGGAVTDLNGFDSYLLAANVAQFPLPVLTGIGHERDDTIVDLVAHLRLKTPTAVAAFLIERRGQEMAQVDDLRRRLVEAVRQRLHKEGQRQERVASHLTLAVSQQLAMQRRMYQLLAHRYAIASTQFFSRQREQLTRQSVALQSAVRLDLQLRHQQMEALLPRIPLALERYFQRKHDQHTLIERSLRLAGPERILAMGFSITLKNGKPIRSAASLRPGDILETRLAEGSVQSVVQESSKPQNE